MTRPLLEPMNILDHDSFVTSSVGLPARLVSLESNHGLTLEEQLTPNVKYTGRAVYGSLTTDPVWQIKRTITSGTLTRTEFVDSGKFTQIWDNRSVLFTPAFTNPASTYFDGINDFVSLGNNLNYDRNTAFSMSLWYRPQNQGDPDGYLYSKMINGQGVYIRMNNKKLEVVMGSSGALLTKITTGDSFLSLIWTHVVVTYDGSRLASGWKIYLNGVDTAFTVNNNTLTDVSILSTETAKIGSYGNKYATGHIDEFSVYTDVLTSAEAVEIYNGGEPFNLLDFSNSAIIVHWWRMGDVGFDSFPNIMDQIDSVNGLCTNMTASNFQAVTP